MGVCLLLLAALANEWVLAPLLAEPGLGVMGATRVKLWLLMTILALTGIALLAGHRALTLRAVKEWCASRHPRLGGLILSVASLIVFVAMIEASFLVVNTLRAWNDPNKLERTYGFMRSLTDPVIGIRPRPGKKQLDEVKLRGQRLYSVSYSIDEFGRREVPSSTSTVPKDKAMLFFGCSFAFGVGCEDDETLPHYVAELLPEYQVYNYAYGGYGPHQAVALLDDVRYVSSIREREEVIGVYVFFPPQLRRQAVAAPGIRDSWVRLSPCYELGKDGWPQYRGLFPNAQPWRTAFYDLMSNEQVRAFLGVNYPMAVPEAVYELNAGLLRAVGGRLWEHFKAHRFYVVVHPVNTGNAEEARAAIPYMEKAKLQVLDYSELFPRDDPAYSYPVEGHPTPHSHKALATALASDLVALKTTKWDDFKAQRKSAPTPGAPPASGP